MIQPHLSVVRLARARNGWRSAALAAGASCAIVAPALAQTPAMEAAFDRTQRAPLDHDATFDYVRTATQARDYEAAIAALERILAYNPHLARAEYELGVLYFRLRSFEQATLHFEAAAANPALDEATRRRIAGFLPQARKELQRSRLTAVFQIGGRYATNPASAPGGSFVRAFGLDLPTWRTYRKAGDGGVFGLGDISHVYDFENGRGDAWESRLTAYGAHYFRFSGLDAGLAEFNTGPRLAIAPDALPGWTIRPYAVGGGALAFGGVYSTSYGGGLSLGYAATPFLSFEATGEARSVYARGFDGLANKGLLSTGALFTGSLGAVWRATDAVTLTSKVFVARNAAQSAPSSTMVGLEGAAKIEYAPPFEAIGMNWSVTPYARYLSADFSRADWVVDPFRARRDRQLRVGAQFDMPIDANFGVAANAHYLSNASNLSPYRSTGWSFMIGPTLRF